MPIYRAKDNDVACSLVYNQELSETTKKFSNGKNEKNKQTNKQNKKPSIPMTRQQLKRMNRDYMNQHEELSKARCWIKKKKITDIKYNGNYVKFLKYKNTMLLYHK